MPKGGTSVDPTTFVKVYYADADTIDKSNTLFKDMVDKKIDKQEKHRQTVRDVANKSKQFAADVGNKITPHKKNSDK